MTTDENRDEKEALAAEYALGLLSQDDLARAKELAATDRAFAAEVTRWEMQLAALADDLAPVPPRRATKTALMTEIFGRGHRASLWNRLGVWQFAAVASLTALAFVLALEPREPQVMSGPLYPAEIVDDSGGFRVVAVVDKTSDTLLLTRLSGGAPEGRILQVWAHGEGEPAISVGLWPDGDTIRLALPPTIAAVEGVLTLGVSEEPPGGSPTGSPSGRVFGTVDIPGVARR